MSVTSFSTTVDSISFIPYNNKKYIYSVKFYH